MAQTRPEQVFIDGISFELFYPSTCPFDLKECESCGDKLWQFSQHGPGLVFLYGLSQSRPGEHKTATLESVCLHCLKKDRPEVAKVFFPEEPPKPGRTLSLF